nr:uncharacterized protein LOC112698247 [Arachis hypogaea]
MWLSASYPTPPYAMLQASKNKLQKDQNKKERNTAPALGNYKVRKYSFMTMNSPGGVLANELLVGWVIVCGVLSEIDFVALDNVLLGGSFVGLTGVDETYEQKYVK